MSEPAPPQIVPAGDAAALVVFGEEISPELNARVRALAAALDRDRPAGVAESVPAYATLLISYDPLALGLEQLRALVRERAGEAAPPESAEGRQREIPTLFGGAYGPDLPLVAEHHHLSEAEVVRLFTAATYTVYMLGFAPGQPYLGGLPPRLAMPRLERPRERVPAGTVALANQATIYPLATPGGWRWLGRTALKLFDPAADPPNHLQPGDRVRFIPISEVEYLRWAEPGTQRQPSAPGRKCESAQQGPSHLRTHALTPFDPGLEILQPGALTTVQDLGRFGHLRLGLPAAGAMDPFALRVANALAGNGPGAAGLEITVAGPALRFDRHCVIALTGGDLDPRLDGREIANWRSYLVRSGSTLDFAGRRSGARAYLAVSGGLNVAPWLGSRSTCLSAAVGGLEGRALRAGDRLPFGRPGVSLADLAGLVFPDAWRPAYSREPTLRVILGPHADRFTEKGIDTFLAGRYEITPASDRMGYRLQGPPIAHSRGPDLVSCGVPLGGIQVPGNGQPILLMADHQTTGGYPMVATVIQADIPLLAQCLPGDLLRFRAVGLEEARDGLRTLLSGTAAMKEEQDATLWAV